MSGPESFDFAQDRGPRLALSLSKGPARSLRLDLCTQPVDGGLHAALAVRHAECCERHLDHAQGAEDHRRIDMAHMSDAERLARKLADAVAQHHAALLVAVSA